MAHREDFRIDDACKHTSLMLDIEMILRTVYTLFCRSSVKKVAFKEPAEAVECEAIAFKPLNEVWWLCRRFAMQAFMRNITVLIEECKEQSEKHNELHRRYLDGVAFWSVECCKFMDNNHDIDVALLLKFAEHLCFHLGDRFPENKQAGWNIFEFAGQRTATSFTLGKVR